MLAEYVERRSLKLRATDHTASIQPHRSTPALKFVIFSFVICSCSLFPAEAAGEHFTSALIAEPELVHRLVHLWFTAHANYLVLPSVYFQQAAAAAI